MGYLDNTGLARFWGNIKDKFGSSLSLSGSTLKLLSKSGSELSSVTLPTGGGTANPYPVGAIYLSVNSTNPNTLFGGTWERIQDTFLLAAGSTYAAGTIGGEATHKLTVGEMPSHTHKVLYHISSGSQGFGYNYQAKGAWSDLASSSSGVSDVGGNGAHNNMPPYLAVYVWKRVA